MCNTKLNGRKFFIEQRLIDRLLQAFEQQIHLSSKVVNKKVLLKVALRFSICANLVILQVEDRGKYHCQASNTYGTVTSESIQLSFAYVAEFNLKRSNEQGNQYWGKAIFCDPPQHFPGLIRLI